MFFSYDISLKLSGLNILYYLYHCAELYNNIDQIYECSMKYKFKMFDQ